MQMMPKDSRVPYFSFQDVEEEIEDPVVSAQLGYSVPKVTTHIYVTPHGDRNPLDFVALEWLDRKEKEARQGMYDPSWVRSFREGYKLFKEGKEIPRHGIPLITYDRLSKARRTQLATKYPTVEDLAAVPDSALGDIGMDGRVIRDLARGDIQAKKDLSPVVKELANANETIRRQEEMLAELALRLEALESDSKRKK